MNFFILFIHVVYFFFLFFGYYFVNKKYNYIERTWRLDSMYSWHCHNVPRVIGALRNVSSTQPAGLNSCQTSPELLVVLLCIGMIHIICMYIYCTPIDRRFLYFSFLYLSLIVCTANPWLHTYALFTNWIFFISTGKYPLNFRFYLHSFFHTITIKPHKLVDYLYIYTVKLTCNIIYYTMYFVVA